MAKSKQANRNQPSTAVGRATEPNLQDELEPKINPADDFYLYVNQRWRDAHPIPDNKPGIGAATILNDQNTERLKELLESSPRQADSLNIKRLKSFYSSGMDEKGIQAAGIEPLGPVLDAIEKINNPESLKDFITSRHAEGLALVWRLGRDIDDKDSSRYIVRIEQSGLGLPDRDYYLQNNPHFAGIRKKYQQFLTDLFTLLGVNDPNKSAKSVYGLELKLAKVSATSVERRDSEAMYNLFNLQQLADVLPGLGWSGYLGSVGLGQSKDIVVSQPKFMIAALKLLADQPLEAWKSYLIAHTLIPLMGMLPKDFEELKFDFYGRTLQGAKKPEPRYRLVLGRLRQVLPEPLGQLFVDAFFDQDAKHEIYDLVEHIKQSMRQHIEALSWMSQQTKERALEKLETFLPLLGYPDQWKDFSTLDTSRSYVENYLAAVSFDWQRDIASVAGPVDRREWLMSPAEVNAYYWPNTNEITFPAGILQPPFFYAKGDFAANYGAIGTVIGHEMTHGFDDQGSKFDQYGNLNSWWTEADRQAFESRANKLVKQYNAYQLEGRSVNGQLTLGENIADLGGVAIAYDAMLKKIEETGDRGPIGGLSPQQRFFISFARVWRNNYRSELTLNLLVTDTHSPDQFRTNGVLANSQAFYDVFNCEPSNKLYKSKNQRIRIW